MIFPLSRTLKTIHPQSNKLNPTEILPLNSSLTDLVGYDENSRGEKLYIIDLTHFLLYVRYTHSFGIQGDNKLFNGKTTTFILGDHYRFKLTITTTRNGYDRLTMFRLNLLRKLPIRELSLLLPATEFFS